MAELFSGMRDVPLVSLVEALEVLRGGPHADVYDNLVRSRTFDQALASGARILDGGRYPTMTVDEAAAIHLLTMETPLFRTLNTAIRNEVADAFAPFKPYVKLLLIALYKLPIEKCTLYRGMRGPLHFTAGETIVWWSCTSVTRRAQAAEAMLGFGGGSSTKFILESMPCVNISEFSPFPEESEHLLLPGTALQVLHVMELGNGRRDVQAEFIKGHAVFDFMHPQWPLDLLV
jgi:hypothetical protein